MNMDCVNDARQTEIHTAAPLVPQPSPLEVQTATTKFKMYESPGTEQKSG
jgi:hypothetical protein